jgi:hypothetical protein
MGRVKTKGAGTEDKRARQSVDKLFTKQRKMNRKQELMQTEEKLETVQMDTAEKTRTYKVPKKERANRMVETAEVEKKTRPKTKGSTSNSIAQKNRPLQEKAGDQWEKDYEGLVAAIEKNAGLLQDGDKHTHWLQTQRKQYDCELLPATRLTQLDNLSESHDFSWLHAGFRRKRFEKSLLMREKWLAERLSRDAWLKEQRDLHDKGRIPPEFHFALQILLDLADEA